MLCELDQLLLPIGGNELLSLFDPLKSNANISSTIIIHELRQSLYCSRSAFFLVKVCLAIDFAKSSLVILLPL